MSIDRQKGIKALSSALKSEKNCQMFEKIIYDLSCTEVQDGKSNFKYNWYIYQAVGLLLKDITGMKSHFKEVKAGRVGWNSTTYDSVRSKIVEHDEYLVKPFDVVEGVAQCGKCGSKKTWSVAKQMRSGDEGTSTISRCVECGNHWVYSG